MAALGTLFFVVAPTALLLALTRLENTATAAQVAESLDILPAPARESLRGDTDIARSSYALAVYLLAPVAVVVPLTISTAIGAATLVGERERGTGEFLAHSPASIGEIYLGKLLASIVPGYLTALVGFGLYSLIVNLIVGPDVGGWFFPTGPWWLLVMWVVPPFLAFTLSVIVRLSGRVSSTAAAQQAAGLVSLPLILVAYTQATGTVVASTRQAMLVGAIAWLLAGASLLSGMRGLTRARLLGVAGES